MAPATKIEAHEPPANRIAKHSTGNHIEYLLQEVKYGFEEEEREQYAFSLDRLPHMEKIFGHYFELGQELHREGLGLRTLTEVSPKLSNEGQALILATAKLIAEQHYRIQVFMEKYYSSYIQFCIEADSFRTCKLRSAIEFFFAMYDENMDLEDDYGQLKDYFEMIKFEAQYEDLDERFTDWYKLECILDEGTIPTDMPEGHWWWF